MNTNLIAEAITLGCTNSVQMRSFMMIKEYKVYTDKDEKRLDTATDMLYTDILNVELGKPSDDGLAGKIAEILGRDEDSTLIKVRPQGRNDLYIIVNGKRKPCEYKTNGGRIGSLWELSSRSQEARFIVYQLDFIVKAGKPRKDGTCKPAEHRKACKVMTVKAFIQLLEKTGAYKTIGHTDSDREIAVQSDSKKLYKELLTGGYADYDREKTYELWELV